MGGAHWHELFHEVVETGLCTGCGACVMACPRDVLGYTDEQLPVQLGEGMAADECAIGERGCDICTRACPRFRAWEPEFDRALFGREREADEPYGIARELLLTRTTDAQVAAVGQDGGLVSTLLIYGLERGWIDGALTSRVADDRRPFEPMPTLVVDRAGVLASAGSRYTYAANPLAMAEAEQQGRKQLALVGMSCQASINGAVRARRVNKYARRIALTIGLMCSRAFTYEGQRQVLADHGIDPADVVASNVKGRLMVSTRDGEEHVIPLSELDAHTRPGCQLCPDFTAQHADISAGGIGSFDDRTLTIVRTERGQRWLHAAIDAGWIEASPASDDPRALALLDRIARSSRRRWPVDRLAGDHARPGLLPSAS